MVNDESRITGLNMERITLYQTLKLFLSRDKALGWILFDKFQLFC